MARPPNLHHIPFKRRNRKVTVVGGSIGMTIPTEIVEEGQVVRGMPYDMRAYRNGSGLVVVAHIHPGGKKDEHH